MAKDFSSGASSLGASSLRKGRFSKPTDPILDAIHVSVDFDQRLASEDIAVSIAHCRMLMHCSIIPKSDGKAIVQALDAIRGEITAGTFVWKREHEDVHMNIEVRLDEMIGDSASYLHTARSRNDQVACDLRLWLRKAMAQMDRQLQLLQESLIKRAEEHHGSVMPGYTHLQMAQPVTFGHHLLAYVEMFGRDRRRLRDAGRRVNESPLGAAALAGTSFPIDRQFTARELGFSRVMVNSLDAVSSRDFACEFLSVAAISAMHISRIGEEIVLWMSQPFSFITLSDAWSTGSSIMPHKRNPDAAELIRGKAGILFGQWTILLTALKGLPLAYSKDMQEDKIPVFTAFDTWKLCIEALTGMIHDMQVNVEALHAAAGGAEVNDLADILVRDAGMPFRQAYHEVARLVRVAEEKGMTLAQLDIKDLQAHCPKITVAMRRKATGLPDTRSSFGGAAPVRVKEAVATARAFWLGDQWKE